MMSVQKHSIVSGTSVTHTHIAGVLRKYETLDSVLVLLFWQGGYGRCNTSLDRYFKTSTHQDAKENPFD